MEKWKGKEVVPFKFISFYKITKIVRAFWLVKNLWFIYAGKLILLLKIIL